MLSYLEAQKQIKKLEKSGKWSKLPSNEVIKKTASALSANGFDCEVFQDSQKAKNRVIELIPEGSEVMTMTSRTLDSLGLVKIFNESGKYNSIKAKLMKMDRSTQSLEMQKLGAAAQYSIGSVHAITEDGHVLIASNSGSQLPGYAYGSENVIWAVGAQKIVKNVQEGIKRINERSLPLESVRIHESLGIEGSNVSKLLIMNKETKLGRIKVILIKEVLGF